MAKKKARNHISAAQARALMPEARENRNKRRREKYANKCQAELDAIVKEKKDREQLLEEHHIATRIDGDEDWKPFEDEEVDHEAIREGLKDEPGHLFSGTEKFREITLGHTEEPNELSTVRSPYTLPIWLIATILFCWMICNVTLHVVHIEIIKESVNDCKAMNAKAEKAMNAKAEKAMEEQSKMVGSRAPLVIHQSPPPFDIDKDWPKLKKSPKQ